MSPAATGSRSSDTPKVVSLTGVLGQIIKVFVIINSENISLLIWELIKYFLHLLTWSSVTVATGWIFSGNHLLFSSSFLTGNVHFGKIILFSVSSAPQVIPVPAEPRTEGGVRPDPVTIAVVVVGTVGNLPHIHVRILSTNMRVRPSGLNCEKSPTCCLFLLV